MQFVCIYLDALYGSDSLYRHQCIIYKLFIQIARRLLGKIMIDLRNTREEALSVAELKGSQDNLAVNKTTKEDTEYHTKPHTRNEESRRTSFNSERSMDQDDDDDKEPKYRLDPKYVVPFIHLIRCSVNL